ncbi:MAG: tryptophan--tRNA ligase [Gammaproteobacteria bacterium]
MSKDTVFSGVQPTGDIHLGNYLGAIKQFLNFQNDTDSIFCIVDQHAITVFQDPEELKQNVYSVLSIFLACGLDPKKCILFNQSAVREHSVLSWYLSCTARVGWLNRMTQFKDKAGKNRDNASLGLYAYPVLMAADILLYNADKVPVGDDQKQHLELTRDIAHKFNTDYKKIFFKLPEPIINKAAPRIMSLRDANNKMSKSDISKYSRILLTDSNDEISAKINKAKSDSLAMPTSSDQLANRPEINNLITIYSSISNIEKDKVVALFANKEISSFKNELKEVVINLIEPISKEIQKIMNDKKYLQETLNNGSLKARERANKMILELNSVMGFNFD